MSTAYFQEQLFQLDSYIRLDNEREYVLLQDVLDLLRSAEQPEPEPAIPLNSLIDLLHRADALLVRIFNPLRLPEQREQLKEALPLIEEIRALIPLLDKARDHR